MSGTVMQIVRVAILADSRLTEMALPAELPLREILPAVQRLVVPSAQNGDGGQADSGAAVQLSLAPVGGQPFSLDASLDTVGVVDGDLLVLQPVPAGPAAPGIVEDIADAAMIFSTSRLKPWGIAHIQRGALAAVIAVALLATGLTVTYRVATGVLAGLLAVAGIAVASALAGLLITIRSPRSGIALSIAALVPIGAALALAVPGKFGPAQVLLGAAGVAAWSLIALMIPSAERERVVAFFTAAAVVGASVALAAGAQLLWQLPLLSIGCGLIVAALLVTIQAAQLSALWARFPLPVIPAPGDPTPSAPPLRLLEDLPRRVRVSDAHQSGFIAAAVLLSVLGSVAIAVRPEALSVVGWYLVAATAAAATPARAGVGFGRMQGVAAGSALSGSRGPVGVLHHDRTLCRRVRRGAGASRAHAGLGCGGTEPGHRFAGELLAAAAPAAGFGRRRAGCFADPRHGLPGRIVRLGAQQMIRAAFACLAATVVVAGWWTPPAWAIGPPVVDAAAQPPSGDPGPVAPMEQRGACSVSGVIPGTDPGVPTPSQTMLNLPAAWQFSRGEGQLVAIIDTGVQPGPRLPNVDAGGDFVESTDGLTDCDGHGTLVAGIVAGQPGNDGFSGVAPAARLLSIRAMSTKFSPRTSGGDPQLAQATLDVAVLAGAIVHAADLGAKVINVSTITCLPADRMVDQAALGAAIRYAAVDKDAVIVAAAGNTGASGSVSASCDSNPLTDLSRPDDPRNWAGVTSVSIPSWWQPYVLSVASLTSAGQPSKFSMPGPWVGIAAPGENIASVSNSGDGALANGLPTPTRNWWLSAAPATRPAMSPGWPRWSAAAIPG